MADFNKIFEKTIVKEGAYQNQSADPGNYCNGKLIGTKYGIAATGYQAFYKRCPTVEQMKALTKDEAKRIWKFIIWDRIKGDIVLNDSIAELMLDSAGGGANGYLHIRQAINKSLGVQKVAENKTMQLSTAEINLLNSIPAKKYFDSLYNIRLKYFKNQPNKKYINGWINRLNKVYNSFIDTLIDTVKKNPKTAAGSVLIFGLLLVGVISLSKK